MSAGPFSVSVEGLSKRYRIGVHEQRSESLVADVAKRIVAPVRNFRDLRRLHRFGGADEPSIVWALKDVSFELQPGEVLGVIGRNGAGKSTLLKVLSRITDPTEGRALLRGRTASLLEVGTGFHGDLTGRENVFLNGSMLGMRRREILDRFDEIIEFSGISQFIDTPVKRYSSGMYIRLAFAVAAHLEPDILIADEVLAVGDIEFQRKCLGKMREVAGGGRTVIFVSHNQASVASLCSRAIWLDRGRVRMDGEVDEVATAYLAAVSAHDDGDLVARHDRAGNGTLRFKRAELLDGGGKPVATLVAGEPATLALDYTARSDLRAVRVFVFLDSSLGERIATFATDFTEYDLLNVPREGRILCRLGALPLNGGDYSWSVTAKVDGLTADQISDVLSFTVDATQFYATHRHPPLQGGALLVAGAWEVE
jgi:lipopolysaccharide transport system ATP-binding protein